MLYSCKLVLSQQTPTMWYLNQKGRKEADTQYAHRLSQCPTSESSFQSEYLSLTDANKIQNARVLLAFHIISCIPAGKLKNCITSTKLYTTFSQTSSKFSLTIHFSQSLNRPFKVLYKTKDTIQQILCCLFLLLRWCSIAREFGMRWEYQQQYWQLLPGTALQLFGYSTFHLNHWHSLTKEWLCNPVFQWIQNKPENCRLIPALQEQPCALRQLAVVPVFNEHLVILT